MKKTMEQKIICDLIYDFVDKNWDKINLKAVYIPKTKQGFLKEVKSNFHTAMWVLSEVCNWGMDKRDYLEELYVMLQEDCDFRVLKIGDKYIKQIYNRTDYTYSVSFTEPKTKMVEYFD